MRRFLRAKVSGCSEAPHCHCRLIELPSDGPMSLTLEARLIRLIGWHDSLGKDVRITIETLERKDG